MPDPSASGEFTLDAYRAILRAASENGYRFSKFDEDQAVDRRVYLRHDVDRTVDDALTLGRIAADEGASGTFFFLLRTAAYNFLTRRCIAAATELISMGHAVGLHFNGLEHGSPGSDDLLRSRINGDAKLLGQALGHPVTAFSMHNPEGNFRIDVPGLINAYDPRFFDHAYYVSDSNRRWKPEFPLRVFAELKPAIVQILVHPEWHGMATDSERGALLGVICRAVAELMDENNSQNRTLQADPISLTDVARSLLAADSVKPTSPQ